MPRCQQNHCRLDAHPGRSRCRKHLNYINNLTAARKKAGLCAQFGCPNPPSPGKTYCPTCLLVKNERTRKSKRKKRAEKSTCHSCMKNPPEAGRTYCAGCGANATAAAVMRYATKRKAGLCTIDGCRNPAGDKAYCDHHAAVNNRNSALKYAVRRAAGLCVWGGCLATTDKAYCELHAARKRADCKARYWARRGVSNPSSPAGG